MKVSNYYQTPVTVVTGNCITGPGEKIIDDLPSGEVKDASMSLSNVKEMCITAKSPKDGVSHVLNRVVINDPSEIQTIHIGMISGHIDLSLAGEGTKSSLGTAIPRINLVNHMAKPLRLEIGTQKVSLGIQGSGLYLGEKSAGLHLGITIRDLDGILPDYVLDRPISELHFGIVSHLPIPLYTGSKLSFTHPSHSVLSDYRTPVFAGGSADHYVAGASRPHHGATADRSYIA